MAQPIYSTEKRWWRHGIEALENAADKHKWLLVAATSGFVLLKVVWITRGDIPSALGVFNSAGPVTVFVGGLLSALPLVSALVLSLVLFELAWHFRSAFRRRTVWLAWLIACVGCFFLTPWPLAAASVLLGGLSGLVMRIEKRPARHILLSAWILLSIYLILHPLLYAVWLPRETLTVTKGVSPGHTNRQYVAGYVLSDSSGWISLLQTGQRAISRFRSQEVTARALCQGQVLSMPYAPQWYKSGHSLWKTISPNSSRALPPCHSSGAVSSPGKAPS